MVIYSGILKWFTAPAERTNCLSLPLIALIAIKAIDVTADGRAGYGAKPHISCPAIVIFKSLACQYGIYSQGDLFRRPSVA